MALDLKGRRARYDELFGMLRQLAGQQPAGTFDQLDHSLQCATRALDAQAPPDQVFAALMHDVSRPLSPRCHGLASADLIRPLVSDASYWMVRIHDHLMLRHVAPEPGLVSEAQRYRGEAWFPLALRFADEWDLPAVLPGGRALPPGFFYPLLYNACVRPDLP